MKNKISVQPFPLLYNRNDIHIMLYMEGHPEYEAVEAMIQEQKNGKAIIRAIVTRHGGAQTDYINDKNTIERIKKDPVKRDINLSEMKYSRDMYNLHSRECVTMKP